ncbi:hypothetical protein [Mesorhizobium australicum]|uniref:hypothetical protein n=1 Tax=Mesorhizobium australicum TaxID=536018 RepID=UPI003334CB28
MAHIGTLLLEGGQLVGGEATEQVGGRGKGQVSFSPEKAFVPFQKTISKIEPNGKGMIEALADLARQLEPHYPDLSGNTGQRHRNHSKRSMAHGMICSMRMVTAFP